MASLRTRVAAGFSWLSWLALVATACGSDGNSGAWVDGGPDGAGGSGLSGGTGGSSATGGTGGSLSSGGTGGSLSSGGTGGSLSSGGASGAGAGTACIPPDQLPPPVPRSVGVGRSCGGAPTCGGTPAAGEWAVTDVCFDAQTVFPGAFGRCSAVQVSGSGSAPSGSLTFSAGTLTGSASADASALLTFPNACHGCRCADLEGQLQAAGVPGVSCSPQCLGGDCICFADASAAFNFSGGWSGAGSTMTTSAGSFEYCADTTTLTLEQGGVTLTLQPASAVFTPERCNGRDDDGNGTIDDAPVECATCATEGVCGDGADTACTGGTWRCVYRSPAWESDEVTCDRLDNDCDGEADEGLDCAERCDGIDNDANGLIDDDPLGAPSCGTVGVCSGAATCDGAAGWRCGGSAAFQAVETRCDSQDNDCDGLTDEVCCPSGSGRIYYVRLETGVGTHFERVAVDGSNQELLFTLPSGQYPIGLALDPVAGRLYWAEVVAGTISRAAHDGTSLEVLRTGLFQPRIALDLARRELVYVGATGIESTSLDDPTSSTTIRSGVASSLAMAVDPVTGTIFLGQGQGIGRLERDGTGLVETTDISLYGQVIEGITVDAVQRKLWWQSTGGIHRGNLDLSSPERIVAIGGSHAGLDLDAAGRRLFWGGNSAGTIEWIDPDAVAPTVTPITPGGYVLMGTYVACPPP